MTSYLLHHLLGQADTDEDRTAIIDGDREISYRRLRTAVDELVGRLVDAGIQRGDRIAFCLPKSIEECICVFAISRADAVFVPINPKLKGRQVRHIIQDCGATAFISNADLVDRLGDALEGIDCLQNTLIVEIDGKDGGCKPGLPDCKCIGEDLAAILYTSGSTGKPKGVMLSHRNLLAGTRIVRSYLNITCDDRLLSILPFSFDYGLNQLLTTVEQGAVLVLHTFRLGDEIVQALRDHEITGLAGVPSIWSILTRAAPSLSRTPLPSLRYITNSGGAVPSATLAKLRELLPHSQIFLMYGLTEAFRSTFLPPDEIENRPTSIGKAIPECEVFPVTSGGRIAEPGETGILVHRGPTVSLGYWNRPEETAHVIRPLPNTAGGGTGEMVCWSGDIVKMDEKGFLYFVGREDAMIKSAGYRISPTEVEEAIMAGGGFRQVAVIGLPDDFMGQKPHAVAVAANGAVDTISVLQGVADQLPAYMVPRQIELVDALPTTPTGKIDYKHLVKERKLQLC